ncbi:hypothetical protein [Fimbriiglobus ruber]|uniref:Uncharacterized protein n=1 Tax=Fimbriiglobus ruber TaxID=1908690 RepID=A0A225DN14_9BACT|nr:hypothetical protein [Fimbriiglobus ruber]OWK35222.1 hypothetical protein FRUB_10064 [Fimbriiglobus ruber]OWK35430.1 hypothetical protein FRUB_07993 [Fimbriiglobus ruber]OWK42433.1 hypothetical protein FRUB_04511 [Fimbriiglobus ruber]
MFSNVHSVSLGSKRLLRLLHDEQMRKFRQAPREDREQFAEQAAKYRDMMSALDMIGMLAYAGRR